MDLERLAGLITDLRSSCADANQLLAEAEGPFRSTLSPKLLPSELIRPDRVQTARFLLYRDDAVTLFAIASAPGAVSDIHDHGTWGLVGQVMGQEVEHAYQIEYVDAEGVALEHVSRRHLKPGDVTLVLPPERDIHRVVTVSPEPSVSIHAFAHDLVHHGFTRFTPGRYSARPYSGGSWDNEPPSGSASDPDRAP